jgi:hypothetical protein
MLVSLLLPEDIELCSLHLSLSLFKSISPGQLKLDSSSKVGLRSFCEDFDNLLYTYL